MEDYSAKRIGVSDTFREVFTHFYCAKNNGNKVISKTLFTSYQMLMIFNFEASTKITSKANDEIEIEKCMVLGPVKQAFNYKMLPGSEILVVNFKDDGFYRFFGGYLEQNNEPVHPDYLVDEDCFSSLWTSLNELTDPKQRIDRILEFSRPYIKKRTAIMKRLLNFNDKKFHPIKSVAEMENQSVRSIQSKHKQALGYTAKEISRFERFLKAVKILENLASHSAKPDWMEIVSHCGYYDQSQLIHDFKHYLKLSPTTYLKFQHEVCHSKL